MGGYNSQNIGSRRQVWNGTETNPGWFNTQRFI